MKSNQAKARVSQLRIIAGEWRSRRFTFTEQPGLRPTPDRVRETLFNWLSSDVPGAHCLDPFTGSGALTLEALSRGAASALDGVVLATGASQAADQVRQRLQLGSLTPLQQCSQGLDAITRASQQIRSGDADLGK